MCSPAAIGPAVGAIGQAAGISAQNKAQKRAYEHRMKVRERKWMQRRTTYATKKVQFEQEVDLANIAAQRAYSEVNNKLNIARSTAILQNQSDYLKMISTMGDIEARAAERGVGGKSLAKMLITSKANFGMTQAMRSRALTMAYFQAEREKDYTKNRLKTDLNRSFSKVAIQPVADLAEPPPVMQSPGLALMMGMANAVSAGIGGMPENSSKNSYMNQNPSASQQATVSAGESYGYGADTYYTGMPSMGPNSQFYQMYGTGGF